MGLNTVVIPVVRQATNLILKGIHIPIQIWMIFTFILKLIEGSL
jgi:hypothetical protein